MLEAHDMMAEAAWDRLLGVVAGRRIVVLAGAGCSTESGIPDYRGTGAPRRRAPVQYQEFMRSQEAPAMGPAAGHHHVDGNAVARCLPEVDRAELWMLLHDAPRAPFP
mgnify:CR=1 FL=1